ncbi:hypothetical protein CYMTET_37386 [Cymbomonas tetramitiformis]|uniref:Uncharacterized protein n=1 Tax=Cymbomonas tetramitiformis TaxID=36881 RepID=A0AAE0F6Q6_9CHLO|nr:hypothetical protein CYMTET_37386 [Cymbomonas tetramitiformis]
MHTLRTYFARASDSPPPTDLANVRTVAREEAKYIADWTAAARELFARAKEGAKNRDIDFALPSPDFLADLAEAQKGRCAITGLRMLPRQPAESEGLPSDECWRRFAPSVDRIRSDGHYTRDNVQLTCVFANVGKAESDDDSFKRFLTGLAIDPTEKNQNAIEAPPLRPPKRKAATRGDVVKRKREVALLQCDAKEKRIKISMSKMEREYAVETTASLPTDSVSYNVDGVRRPSTTVPEWSMIILRWCDTRLRAAEWPFSFSEAIDTQPIFEDFSKNTLPPTHGHISKIGFTKTIKKIFTDSVYSFKGPNNRLKLKFKGIEECETAFRAHLRTKRISLDTL